MKEARNYLLKH